MENLFKNSRDILTVPEVCVMLHICPSKAYRLLNEGRIEAFAVTRHGASRNKVLSGM